jgi:hypothetical protein
MSTDNPLNENISRESSSPADVRLEHRVAPRRPTACRRPVGTEQQQGPLFSPSGQIVHAARCRAWGWAGGVQLTAWLPARGALNGTVNDTGLAGAGRRLRHRPRHVAVAAGGAGHVGRRRGGRRRDVLWARGGGRRRWTLSRFPGRTLPRPTCSGPTADAAAVPLSRRGRLHGSVIKEAYAGGPGGAPLSRAAARTFSRSPPSRDTRCSWVPINAATHA